MIFKLELVNLEENLRIENYLFIKDNDIVRALDDILLILGLSGLKLNTNNKLDIDGSMRGNLRAFVRSAIIFTPLTANY